MKTKNVYELVIPAGAPGGVGYTDKVISKEYKFSNGTETSQRICCGIAILPLRPYRSTLLDISLLQGMLMGVSHFGLSMMQLTHCSFKLLTTLM